MKFLCIGGGGFIGTNFNYFIKKNSYGTVFNLDNGRLCTNMVEYHNFDVSKEPIKRLIPYLRDTDVVINFAAITRVEESIIDPINSFKTNTSIHHNICEGLRILKKEENLNVPCLFISTGGAIAGETSEKIDEKILPKPISVYGASKLSCESLSYSYSKSFDIDIRNLRFTNIYGPFSDHKESVVARFIKSIILKKTIEIRDNGNMKRDFLFVEDACSAIYSMLVHGYPGLTVQFGGGETVSINKIFEILKEIEPNIDFNFSKSLQGEVSSVECNIDFAKEVLKWTPQTTLKSGIYKTWNYFNDK